MSQRRFQFGEPEPQSLVKNAIVQKYFGAWANVMKNHSSGLLCYADFYAGEGMWDDGTPSNPLRILDIAENSPELRRRLVVVLNDKEGAVAERLRENVAAHPATDKLTHQPVVLNHEVGSDDETLLMALPDSPRLCLLDPTGYKGVSLDLIEAITDGYGREAIIFFNMNRIRPAVLNDAVEGRMCDLFGEDHFSSVRERIRRLTGYERELAILEEFAEALGDRGIDFVLPFRFLDSRGTRTSHHLVHVCRHVRGYTIMKEIMAGESSGDADGVPLFEYNPADERYPRLFEYARPLTELPDLLLQRFAGQTLPMRQVFERHHVGTPFVEKNYKAVLLQMEETGKIRAEPSRAQRPRRHGRPTFGPKTKVAFPSLEE